MNKALKIAKVIIPSILLGGVFIWLGIKDLTESQQKEIIHSFKKADYFWICTSLIITTISHISRAIRWQYSLDAVSIKTSFWNRYLTILINYFTNLAIPRAGEITRCTLISRYEKQPFEKVVGTVIIERIIDLVILLLLIAGFIFFQYEVIYDFLMPKIASKFAFLQNISLLSFLIGVVILGIVFLLGLIFFVKKSNSSIVKKLRKFWEGLYDGILTIFTMKNKVRYFIHTIIIWLLYILMFGICFKALPETTNLGLAIIMAGFIFGSLAMVLTQGGLGAYPLFVMQSLVLYGISETTAYTLGWIIWSSQTAMVIIMGIIAFIIFPLYNKKKNK
ncbi:MAG: lysylphosphatidylglycerol synthase transmembrane domain-containing protein [Flavobacteriales bacterium]